eukprot:RCo023924
MSGLRDFDCRSANYSGEYDDRKREGPRRQFRSESTGRFPREIAGVGFRRGPPPRSAVGPATVDRYNQSGRPTERFGAKPVRNVPERSRFGPPRSASVPPRALEAVRPVNASLLVLSDSPFVEFKPIRGREDARVFVARAPQSGRNFSQQHDNWCKDPAQLVEVVSELTQKALGQAVKFEGSVKLHARLGTVQLRHRDLESVGPRLSINEFLDLPRPSYNFDDDVSQEILEQLERIFEKVSSVKVHQFQVFSEEEGKAYRVTAQLKGDKFHVIKVKGVSEKPFVCDVIRPHARGCHDLRFCLRTNAP